MFRGSRLSTELRQSQNGLVQSLEGELYCVAMTASSAARDESPRERWLPIQLNISPIGVAVDWMDFGGYALTDQFFSQTVGRLRSMVPPALECTTSSDLLVAEGRRFPATRPAGLIFHVSRCGSTLLCNVLRTAGGTGILSEARPIERVFKLHAFASSPIPRDAWAHYRKLLANSILGLYANVPSSRALNMVIKACAVDTMQIPMIRSIWPNVPCLVLIRNPLDVLVSNLARPSGWCERQNRPRSHYKIFGEDWGDLPSISVEEYLARGVGSFCRAALPVVDEQCRVIDYESLDLPTIYKIAGFFGIQMPDPHSESVQKAMSTDAKKFNLGCRFEHDCARKRRTASKTAIICVERWAQPHYNALKAKQNW